MLELFEKHYEKIWGSRWPELKKALSQPEESVLRWNAWVMPEALTEEAQKKFPVKSKLGLSAPQGCLWRGDQYFEPTRVTKVFSEASEGPQEDQLLNAYVMDPASILVARALPLRSKDQVLDMCAAPGGKTLILIERMADDAELMANELSAPRRDRLQKVIQNYVPRYVRSRVWVKGRDASLWGVKNAETMDAILLDAPCSGERHLLESEEDMRQWSPKRGEGLAFRQYSMLCSALLSLRSGGYFLYSTCSLNPEENEGVIRKLFKKKEGFKEISVPCEIPGEAREHGQIFLPDKLGFGPLYFCLLQKD